MCPKSTCWPTTAAMPSSGGGDVGTCVVVGTMLHGCVWLGRKKTLLFMFFCIQFKESNKLVLICERLVVSIYMMSLNVRRFNFSLSLSFLKKRF